MNATGSRPHADPEAPGDAPSNQADLAPVAPKGSPTLRLWRALRRLTSPARCRALFRLTAAMRAQGRRRRAETRLTVAVDINSYFEPLSGIGWYLHHLLLELANRDDLRLRLYAHRLVETGDELRTVVPLPAGPAIEWVRCPISEDTNLPAGLLAKVTK